jgi:hypothetical protein
MAGQNVDDAYFQAAVCSPGECQLAGTALDPDHGGVATA